MALYNYKEFTPKLGENVYISPNAHVIGRCHFADNVNLWFNSTARGDVNDIIIGANTNVQDHSVLHVTEKDSLQIGKNTSIGHGVTLHGCIVGDECLIGMGAIILDGAQISNRCIVAAGSVVSPNKTFPEGVMIMGAPAKVVRELTEAELNFISNHYKSYLKYAQDFKDGSVVRID